MKIEIPVAELVKAMNIVNSVVPKKSTLPILANVYLQAIDKKLILLATDLDVGIRLIKECNVIEEGTCTISAKSLHDIVKILSGPDV